MDFANKKMVKTVVKTKKMGMNVGKLFSMIFSFLKLMNKIFTPTKTVEYRKNAPFFRPNHVNHRLISVVKQA
jgi:hypothetical protein